MGRELWDAIKVVVAIAERGPLPLTKEEDDAIVLLKRATTGELLKPRIVDGGELARG